MTTMTTWDHGKLLILAVTLIGGFAMVLIRDDLVNPGIGLIGTVVGYVTGNGVAAVRRTPPSPVIVPKLATPELERRHQEIDETIHTLKAVAREQAATDRAARRPIRAPGRG